MILLVHFNVTVLVADILEKTTAHSCKSTTKASHNSDLYRHTEHTDRNLLHAYCTAVACLCMPQMFQVIDTKMDVLRK